MRTLDSDDPKKLPFTKFDEGQLLKITLTLAIVFAILIPHAAEASIIFYLNDESGFSAAMSSRQLIGIEDFEEGIDQGGETTLTSPLEQGTPNTAAFPSGLSQPLTVSKPGGLFFGGATTDPYGVGTSIVVTGGFPIDYIFNSSDQITGVGFDLYQLFSAGTVSVAVYDQNGSSLGSITMPGDPAGSNFLGIATNAGDLIGRVSIGQSWTGLSNNGGADNIQIYSAVVAVPEPSTGLVFALGLIGAIGLRRRKNSGGKFGLRVLARVLRGRPRARTLASLARCLTFHVTARPPCPVPTGTVPAPHGYPSCP